MLTSDLRNEFEDFSGGLGARMALMASRYY